MRFIYSKLFAAFAICLLIVAVFLFMQAKGWLQPIETALLDVPRPVIAVVQTAVRPLKFFLNTVKSIRGIIKENADLRNQVAALQQRTVDTDILRNENEILRTELGFSDKSTLKLQSCTILVQDPQQLVDTVKLSCGQKNGLREGQAVIAEGYLVGKIIFAGQDNSTMVLITDAQSSVDAQISQSGVNGVIKGSFGSGAVMDLIPQNATVNPGDLIMTAGINNVIPKGIVVGSVGQILSKPNDLFKKVSIVSPVQFYDLQFVFVVK
jgi:rod shape-determining protein MreC